MEHIASPNLSSPMSSSNAHLSHMHRSPPTTWTHVQRQCDIGSTSNDQNTVPFPHSPTVPSAEDTRAPYPYETQMLISPSSPRRTPRLPALQPHQFGPSHHPTSTIPSPDQSIYQYNRQNVRPNVVNGFQAPNPTDSSSGYLGLPAPSFESSRLSTFPPPQHAINQSPPRLRTSNQVFHTTSDLAAHHGIPRSLPPPPRTTPRRLSDPDQPPVAPFPSEHSFASLCSNYLQMINPQNAEQSTSTTEQHDSAPVNDMFDDSEAAQAVIQALSGSMDGVFNLEDFLTSPMESPLDDEMLTTPALGLSDMSTSPDIFASPAIMDMVHDFGGEMSSLFPENSGYEYDSKPTSTHRQMVGPPQLLTPNFDDLYTLSPDTPALDTPSMSPFPTSHRRKSAPTGTRKNVTPESLVPLDAPIQPRKYVTPSQTSRKELPATFARKRQRSEALGDDDGEDGSVNPSMSEEDAIKAKRLQNTLAARRSRKRKLEYQRELEDALELERRDKEMWKARALVLEGLLRDQGHSVPRIDDA